MAKRPPPPPAAVRYVDSAGTLYEYGHRQPWGLGLYRVDGAPDSTPVQKEKEFLISQQWPIFKKI